MLMRFLCISSLLVYWALCYESNSMTSFFVHVWKKNISHEWIPHFTCWFLLSINLPDGEKACSCYTFENRERVAAFSWPKAREWCESNNKLLVVMETIEEWEFINSSLKDHIGNAFNEWHIGLLKNQTTGNWRWINGEPLTFDKWQNGVPRELTFYVLIASCLLYTSPSPRDA